MNVSCTRSSRSPSGAPALARKRASARACRRTSSAAACSSPPCQAAISTASAASDWAWGMRVGTVDVWGASILRRPCISRCPPLASRFERSFELHMRPYDERLDHLLARAAKVFAERGYHSTTMRDLAAASGMSLAGMYYYVKGKEELLSLIEER